MAGSCGFPGTGGCTGVRQSPRCSARCSESAPGGSNPPVLLNFGELGTMVCPARAVRRYCCLFMDFWGATCQENRGSFKEQKRKPRLTATETEQALRRKKAGFFVEQRQAGRSRGLENSLPQRKLKAQSIEFIGRSLWDEVAPLHEDPHGRGGVQGSPCRRTVRTSELKLRLKLKAFSPIAPWATNDTGRKDGLFVFPAGGGPFLLSQGSSRGPPYWCTGSISERGRRA